MIEPRAELRVKSVRLLSDFGIIEMRGLVTRNGHQASQNAVLATLEGWQDGILSPQTKKQLGLGGSHQARNIFEASQNAICQPSRVARTAF